jgi:hypothetical protein
MIITKLEFLERARIDPPTLEVWIEEEWLIPTRSAPEPVFSEADLAREPAGPTPWPAPGDGGSFEGDSPQARTFGRTGRGAFGG